MGSKRKVQKWLRGNVSRIASGETVTDPAILLPRESLPQGRIGEEPREPVTVAHVGESEPKRKRITEKQPPQVTMSMGKLREYILRMPSLCENLTVEQYIADNPLRREDDAQELQSTMLNVNMNLMSFRLADTNYALMKAASELMGIKLNKKGAEPFRKLLARRIAILMIQDANAST